jgi:CubicO group peptidase (beta-lactamase class C family)
MMTLLPSVFPLGTKMSYCNVGFAVLGRLIEVLRRETYDQAMRRRIFRPLGMTHAMTLPEDALRHRCAVGHVADPKDPKRPMVAPFTHLPQGLKSAGTTPAMSAPDLLKFASAHLEHGRIGGGKRLLSAASALAMQRQQVRLQKYAPAFITAWGLGWALHDFDGHKVIGHDGGTIGQYSFLRISPQKRVAIALLTNGGDALSVYDEIVAALLHDEIRRREPGLPAVDPTLRIDPERYVGRYENIMATIRIDAKDGAFRTSNIPKGQMGTPLMDMPIAFIDRQTIALNTGNPQLDRQTGLFSDLVDGRYAYIQVGGRQYRRVG